MVRRSSCVSILKVRAIVMSSSSAAFFGENFAGTVSVLAGAPGTAKAPLTIGALSVFADAFETANASVTTETLSVFTGASGTANASLTKVLLAAPGESSMRFRATGIGTTSFITNRSLTIGARPRPCGMTVRYILALWPGVSEVFALQGTARATNATAKHTRLKYFMATLLCLDWTRHHDNAPSQGGNPSILPASDVALPRQQRAFDLSLSGSCKALPLVSGRSLPDDDYTELAGSLPRPGIFFLLRNIGRSTE